MSANLQPFNRPRSFDPTIPGKRGMQHFTTGYLEEYHVQ